MGRDLSRSPGKELTPLPAPGALHKGFGVGVGGHSLINRTLGAGWNPGVRDLGGGPRSLDLEDKFLACPSLDG